MSTKNDPVFRVNTTMKWIALTFDIGWGEQVAIPVLSELMRNNVKQATFFLSSSWVLNNPDLARRIKQLGYEIQSHGDLHESYPKHSNEWITKQVKSSEAAIRSVTGHKCTLLRPPYGDHNKRVTDLLHTLGYRTIIWSIDSKDWKNPGVWTIISNTTKQTKRGDIILMHASQSAKQTAQALPFIIQKLRKKGFQFVSVSKLLGVEGK